MKSGLLDLFSAISGKLSLLDWLDSSAFDELVEIDVRENRYRIVCRVEDKSADAPGEGAFTDLYRFVTDKLVHPDDRATYERFMNPETLLDRLGKPSVTGVRGILVQQMRFLTVDGSWRWVELCLIDSSQHGIAGGGIRLYTFDFQTQHDRAERGDAAATQSVREAKTGLYWGLPFIERATALFKELNAPHWCLVAIDLDHFGLFNDWYGRETGDKLLSMLGAELTKAEDMSGGIAGYLGQDDFCLLAPYDEDRVVHLYERLSGLIAKLATSIGFKPAFGISVSDGSQTFDELLDQAHRALEYARKDPKLDIVFYDPRMREQDEREYRVLVEFQRGLQNEEFAVYVQPQCRISTGKIVAGEALARWVKPDGTIVSPNEFVPILEKYGFITDLDCFVWDNVCARIRAWIDRGLKPVPTSVNVSQYDFYSIDVPARFAELLERYNLDPSLLKVEITESAFVESDREIVDAIKRLRAMGLLVLMDDFGSGYSSLNRLSGIEVDGIKLDAAFLHMEGADKRKGIRIVESVINMAKTMALPVICEGVETAEQVDFLVSLGCRFIQGFYFFRPLPKTAFEDIIADESVIDDEGFAVKANEQIQMREFLDENVYSDTMLNTILGPVAYYLWHGDSIDIIRFNEQFYEAVDVPDFSERLCGIERFVPVDEAEAFFGLFSKATKDPLNGASDVVGFLRTDGSLARFIMRVYYLGENDEGKRFYGSVRDVTDVAEMQIQLKMLSSHLQTSVVFMRRMGDRWNLKLIIHGLVDAVGLDYDEFQRELNDGSFLARIDPDDLKRLRAEARRSLAHDEGFSDTFALKGDAGEPRRFWLEAERTTDSIGEASFFLKVVAL